MFKVLFILIFLTGSHYLSYSQCKARVTHVSGDSIVECIKVHVSSWGTVDVNPNGCTETGPYNIGYNFTTRTSANGSYTFTFTPAISSLTLNFSGVSYLDWGKELVRLYVNGQHYKIQSPGNKMNCDAMSVLTNDGDITGCYPCGTSGWVGTIINGSISSLTVLDSCAWGYGNGVKFSLDICGNPINSISLGNDTTLCKGQTLLLKATTPNSIYEWHDGSTDSTFTVKKKGLYWVKITNNCGVKIDSINVNYDSLPTYSLGNDTTLCHSDSILLNTAIPNSSYLWQDNSINPKLLVKQEGIYWVSVSNSCGIKTDTIKINIFPLQTFNLGNDTTLCKGETLILNATTSNSIYLWQDNSTKAIYTVSKQGIYQVRIKNTCQIMSNKLFVKYHSCNCNIYMPNAFTPNLDGRNDKFPPLFDCDFSEYDLKIFNRWGERIFQTNSYNIQWDGTYKGIAQPMGVYVFLFAYKLETGERKINNGTILLIR